MTAYNAMPYLEAAVDSVLEQTFENFEFIIVNDGSQDDSQDYLDSITDVRVKVLHEENRGTAAASNFGLQHCRRQYVARMDADDISLPTRLEKQHNFMELHPEVALVGSQIQVVGEHGPGIVIAMPTKHQAILDALLSLNHGMNHGSCLYRNELIHSLGGYWKAHRTFDDWDMFLRMSEVGQLANLPEVLYQYRTLPSSLVGTQFLEMRKYLIYANRCLLNRRAGEPEPDLDEFLREYDERPWHTKLLEKVDSFALHQYRRAVSEICVNQKLQGYSRLAFAGLCSPSRALQRIRREWLAR